MMQTPGFYKKGIKTNSFVECPYADSKQISEELFELQHDLYYKAKDGRVFLIRRCFVHDGASKEFLKHFGRYTNAAILHDLLYVSKIVSRAEADKLFLEAMEVLEVEGWRRYTYYVFVRVLGRFPYSKYTNAQVIAARKMIQIF